MSNIKDMEIGVIRKHIISNLFNFVSRKTKTVQVDEGLEMLARDGGNVIFAQVESSYPGEV